jgi:hypothetical protein
LILAALKVPDCIQAFIIDSVEGVNYIFLKKGIGHGCPRIEQVHQTVGWNFFKTILAGKKTFKNKNLTTGGVEFLEVVLRDRV